MRARLACLAHLAVRIEADGAVAEGRGPDTAARCGGDVDDPARGEARSAVERDEFAAVEADDAPVFGGEPDGAAADGHGLQGGGARWVAPAAELIGARQMELVQRGRGRHVKAAAGQGEAVRAAVAHSPVAVEFAAVGAEEQAFAGRDVEATRGGEQIVDHAEGRRDGVEAPGVLQDAQAAVESADPEVALELGQDVDVIGADLAGRSDAAPVEPQAGAGRGDDGLAAYPEARCFAGALEAWGNGWNGRRNPIRDAAGET